MRSRLFHTTAAGQLVGLFLCCLVNGVAWATEPNFSETPAGKAQAITSLRTFEALYKTSALGMTLDLKRSLTQEGDTYTLSSRGKNMLINMNESPIFELLTAPLRASARLESQITKNEQTGCSLRPVGWGDR